jgi:hypothetical protein
VGVNAYQEGPVINLSQNATGRYRVYIYDYLGVASPKVVSRARITLGSGGTPIEKWVEVTLRKTSKFANGLVAKNSITFQGNNASVDSWNSEKNPDGTARTPPVSYSSTYRNDMGSVGSIAIASDAVLVKNADIWGYVSNNSGSDTHPPEEFVGTTGSILGDDSPSGTNVDPNRTSTTFSATLDAVTAPPEVLANLGNINYDGLVLPRAGDTVPNGTGDYAGYYVYEAVKIDLDAEKLTINGKVVIKLTAGGTNFSITGGDGEVAIAANGYLALYTGGDVAIAGRGVSNGIDGSDTDLLVDELSELNQPKQFQLFGTATTSQTINYAGSGLFSGVVYAPAAQISIVGNGAICGSVVGDSINLSGNAQFHYDESLADMGADSPFRISKWKELTTATDRNAYYSIINW